MKLKEILTQHNIKADKRLGQNFLVNESVVKRLVAAADIQPTDTVLEIGPGLGALTSELAKRARRVVAVEKDGAMVQILRESLSKHKNIEIVHGDILKWEPRFTLHASRFKIVANLPYYITAPTIRKFLELCQAGPRTEPHTMTLMAQKEVAQRICAKPPRMNVLAVSVQVYAHANIVSYVKKSAFWPRPKVDSAILRIIPLSTPYPLDFPRFFTIVKSGFSRPRKQLLGNLSAGLKLPRSRVEQWLSQNNIAPTQRAQTLTVQDWISLAKEFLGLHP